MGCAKSPAALPKKRRFAQGFPKPGKGLGLRKQHVDSWGADELMSAPPPTLNATSTGCDARRASDRRRWSLLLMSQPSGRSWPKLGASMSAGLTSSKNPRKFMQLFPNLRGSYQCKSARGSSGNEGGSGFRSLEMRTNEWMQEGLCNTLETKPSARMADDRSCFGSNSKLQKRSQPPKWQQNHGKPGQIRISKTKPAAKMAANEERWGIHETKPTAEMAGNANQTMRGEVA